MCACTIEKRRDTEETGAIWLRERYMLLLSLIFLPLKVDLHTDDDGVGVVVDKSASASLLDQHPDHVVVINMQPNFGLSLSSMLSENPKEKPNLSHAKGSSHCRITNK